ncbi:MAG TPA: glycosyltransferase family 87 protein [Polyangiaceae bacterium]|nr:glycosyltransferase family 87 protein [Polyangiaceae bacterium]
MDGGNDYALVSQGKADVRLRDDRALELELRRDVPRERRETTTKRARERELPRWLPALTAGLGLLGAAYLVEGFVHLVHGPMPQDLARRWVQNMYLLRHIAAADVAAGVIPPAADLGPSDPGGYPPWSVAVGFLMAPPVAPHWVQAYFSVQNLLALLAIGRFAYVAGARFGRTGARFLCASALAISTHAVVLRNGQYGLIVNGGLVALVAAEYAQRSRTSGLALAIAALKPQSAAPFALLLFRRASWRGLVVAALTLGLGTACVALWLERNPIALLVLAFRESAGWVPCDSGLLRLLLELGAPQRWAVPLLAVTAVAIGSAVLWRHRAQSILIKGAILAVVARLWTYHRRYDDVLLVFFLVPLGVHALKRRTASAWLGFFAVGLTLWLPLRQEDTGSGLIALKIAVWLAALWQLLAQRDEPALTAGNSAR